MRFPPTKLRNKPLYRNAIGAIKIGLPMKGSAESQRQNTALRSFGAELICYTALNRSHSSIVSTSKFSLFSTAIAAFEIAENQAIHLDLCTQKGDVRRLL